MALSVGKQYSIYTKYNTIVGAKVQVVGILAYNECSKVSYDIKILAINERVIAVKDEDLEEIIGNDNIYWCRETTPKADGSYDEYLVWDSIIDDNKTVSLDDEYYSNVSISFNNSANISLTQIMNVMQNAIATTFGTNVSVSFTSPTKNKTTENNTDVISDESLEKIKGIINSINLWETSIIPAVQKLTETDIAGKIEEIGDDINTISGNIALIKNGL